MQAKDVELVKHLIQQAIDENEIIDLVPPPRPVIKQGGGKAFDMVEQDGKHIEKSDWSTSSSEWGAAAKVTDYLAVPFDVTKPPYYIYATEADNGSGTASWEELESTGSPANDGWFNHVIDRTTDDDDPRKDAAFFKISDHAGVQHVRLT